MTDQERPKKQRWSKRAVRAAAWTAGATAFISALGALGAAPKPAAGQAASSAPRKIIVRRIIKKVVIVGQAKPAPVHVVYSGGGSSGAAPAPAPVTTGGSHP
jgi:hypothetical protein